MRHPRQNLVLMLVLAGVALCARLAGMETTSLAAAAVAVRDGDADAIELAADEQAARIMFVQERIAHNALVPNKPPLPWPGRGDIIEEARKHFGIPFADAGRLVDLAVLHLWDRDREGGDATAVKRNLMLLRFKDLRKIARDALTRPKIETTFVYVDHPTEENTQIEKRVKEKRTVGIDLAALAKLMELETIIAQLEALGVERAGNDGVDRIAAIFAQMDERMAARDGSDGKREIGSKAQQLLIGKVDGKNAAGLAVLQQAWIESQGAGPERPGTNKAIRRAKRIQSKQAHEGTEV